MNSNTDYTIPGNFVAAAVCNAMDSTDIMATACDNWSVRFTSDKQTRQMGLKSYKNLQVHYVCLELTVCKVLTPSKSLPYSPQLVLTSLWLLAGPTFSTKLLPINYKPNVARGLQCIVLSCKNIWLEVCKILLWTLCLAGWHDLCDNDFTQQCQPLLQHPHCKGSCPALPVHYTTVVLRCSHPAAGHRPSAGPYYA